jgi:hypothetical protein
MNRHTNKFHRDIRDISQLSPEARRILRDIEETMEEQTQGEVAAHEPHALFEKKKKVSNRKPISLSLFLTVGFALLHEFLLAGVFLALVIGLTIHEHRSLKNE